MTTYGVYIGRFQPLHNAHWRTIEFALSQVDCLIIVIGSSNQPRTIKNPFSAAERQHESIFCSRTPTHDFRNVS